MSDPSVSPNATTTVKCRAVFLSEDYFLEDDDGEYLEHATKVIEEDPAHADDLGIFRYEYIAPPGYEAMVGKGVLFDHDWTPSGCDSPLHFFQVDRNGKWEPL